LIKIIEIKQAKIKQDIANNILRSLPKWFSFEKAIIDYIEAVKSQLFFTAYNKNKPVGFISIQLINKLDAEIHVMGILEDYQSKGIGKQLLKTSEINLKKKKIKFIFVKTLSSKKRNKFYANTRKFYIHNGFYPLEETTKVWGKENPCLILAKII